MPAARQPALVLVRVLIPALLLPGLVAAAGAEQATAGPAAVALSPRLLAAAARARAALRQAAEEARAALQASVAALQGAGPGEEGTPAAAARALAAAAAASLYGLLADVRQAAHRLRDGASGPQAQKAARLCGDEAERRTDRALAGTVRALGRCASVASAAEQEAARRLARLLQDAEKRAADAAAGAALDACSDLPRLKASLDCLTRQVMSARAELLGRTDAGVRGARALGADAAQAHDSARGCVDRQVEAARVHAASLASWLEGCAAAGRTDADLSLYAD